MVYRRVKQNFSQYEILRNASHYNELQEMVRTEEIEVVVIDSQLHWSQRAEKLLVDYEVPYILFTGNIDELLYKLEHFLSPIGTVDEASTSSSSSVIHKEAEATKPAPKAEVSQTENQRKQIPGVSSTAATASHVEVEKKTNTTPIPPEPKIIERQVIKEVPKYIDRQVIKRVEVPVEKIVEKIVEVPVEKMVEKTVLKTHVVEIKPNFDSIEPDFSLPSILPKLRVPAAQEQPIVIYKNSNGPELIGILGAEEDDHVSELVFTLANSLALLGHKPLVVADGKEEISALEHEVFAGEKEDQEATAFEHEGVSYTRPEATWEYEELLISDYTHIIFWFDSLGSPNDEHNYREWARTHRPILVGSGAIWKINQLRETLDDLSESVRKRSSLILYQAKKAVKKEIAENYGELQLYELPYIQDAFKPQKEAMQWVGQLLQSRKIKRFPFKWVLLILLVLVISALLIWTGLQVPMPKVGE